MNLIESIFSLALIFCMVAGLFCIGCVFTKWLDALLQHHRIATRKNADRNHEGNNTP